MNDPQPHREPAEIHQMMYLGHLVDELKNAMAFAYGTDQEKVIKERVDELVANGVQPSTVRSNVTHWQMVNQVTTESMTFTLNHVMVLQYLESKECLRSGSVGDPTPSP